MDIKLNTGQEVIESSSREKLLGGWISQNLKFTEHILSGDSSLIKTLNTRICGLRKVSRFLSFSSRKMIANGIIMSKIMYLIPVWSGCERYLINSLQIIQNKAARLVTRCDSQTPVSSLLNQCGWLSVSQLGAYHSLVLAFKVKSTKCPQYLFEKMWEKEPFLYNTRSRSESLIRLGRDRQARTELARRSYIYRVTKQWNMLPVDVREAENLNIFKSEVRQWVQKNVEI